MIKTFNIKPISEEEARKLPEKSGIGWLGYCFNLEDFPMLQDLIDGYYTTDGQLFQIKRENGYNVVVFLLFQTNALIKWAETNLQSDEDEEEDYYEPECSACGDGGCFHCEPWRFI